MNPKFQIGDLVTSGHLDGKIGEIIQIKSRGCMVKPYNFKGSPWMVYLWSQSDYQLAKEEMVLRSIRELLYDTRD